MRLPTLQYRKFRGDMIEVYKLSHGSYDEEAADNLLTFRDNIRHYYFRGYRFNLPKERFRTDLRKFTFRCRVTEHWNNVLESIVSAEKLNTFKNRFDKYWEREGILYDADIYIYERTSSRRTRTQLRTRNLYTRGYCLTPRIQYIKYIIRLIYGMIGIRINTRKKNKNGNKIKKLKICKKK